jgi:hypothetical protein
MTQSPFISSVFILLRFNMLHLMIFSWNEFYWLLLTYFLNQANPSTLVFLFYFNNNNKNTILRVHYLNQRNRTVYFDILPLDLFVGWMVFLRENTKTSHGLFSSSLLYASQYLLLLWRYLSLFSIYYYLLLLPLFWHSISEILLVLSFPLKLNLIGPKHTKLIDTSTLSMSKANHLS